LVKYAVEGRGFIELCTFDPRTDQALAPIEAGILEALRRDKGEKREIAPDTNEENTFA